MKYRPERAAHIPLRLVVSLCLGVGVGHIVGLSGTVERPCLAADPPMVAGFERASAGKFRVEDQANLLVSELGCLACHRDAKKTAAVKSPPVSGAVAAKPAPTLSGIRERLNVEWVTAFLENPHVSKPGTTMPHLLGHLPEADRKAKVERLVQYLGSLAVPKNMFDLNVHVAVHPTVPRFWEKGDERIGEQLYRSAGCIACHPSRNQDEDKKGSRLETLRSQGYDEDEIAELVAASGASVVVPEVPHPDLAQKYQKRALAVFLYDPQRFRAGGRMPAMKLSPAETADLVAYLTAQEHAALATEWPAIEPALVKEGQSLFENLGCIQCHTLPGQEPQERAKSLAPSWQAIKNKAARSHQPSRSEESPANSCLAAKPSPANYALSESQRRVIQQSFKALEPAVTESATETSNAKTSNAKKSNAKKSNAKKSNGTKSNGTSSATSDQLTMLRFNCYACHRRDSLGGMGIDRWHHFETRGEVDIGDEGRVPPALTGVGAKLQNAWTAAVLKGEGDIRPHLQIRMPIFKHADIDALPAQLEAADGGSRKKDVDVFAKVPIEAAMAIADTGCIQCHSLTDEFLPGVLGVEIAGMRQRIRPEWFRDFLRNPAELKRRTRMPTFFPQGRSTRPDLLDGDIDKQIASLWWYLADAEGIELPKKLVEGRVHNFELVPDKAPIVLRTFFDKAGTHAICVGLPEKTHFAFDSRQARVALAWRGRFLDAHGTWYDRFVPPAKPLGSDIVALSQGPGLHDLDEAIPWPENNERVRMKGYRLIDGIPTFRYRVGDSEIQDRLTSKNDGLLRQIRLVQTTEKSPRPVWIQLAVGANVKTTATAIQVDKVTLSGDVKPARVVGKNPQRVVVQLGRIDNEPTLETISIHYQW